MTVTGETVCMPSHNGMQTICLQSLCACMHATIIVGCLCEFVDANEMLISPFVCRQVYVLQSVLQCGCCCVCVTVCVAVRVAMCVAVCVAVCVTARVSTCGAVCVAVCYSVLQCFTVCCSACCSV